MSKPYFSLDGMPFQTPGSPVERDINLQAAMERVYNYAFKGGEAEQAQFALAFLEDQVPSLERFCDDMRATFFLDDFMDNDLKKKICIRAYNNMADRLSGRPLKPGC